MRGPDLPGAGPQRASLAETLAAMSPNYGASPYADELGRAGKADRHLPRDRKTIDGRPQPAYIRPTAGQILGKGTNVTSPSHADRILDALTRGPLSSAQLIERLNLSKKQCWQAVYRLRKQGAISTAADKCHQRTDSAPPPPAAPAPDEKSPPESVAASAPDPGDVTADIPALCDRQAIPGDHSSPLPDDLESALDHLSHPPPCIEDIALKLAVLRRLSEITEPSIARVLNALHEDLVRLSRSSSEQEGT